MKTLIIKPQITPLSGTIRVPGDKSISHRSLLLGGIAEGRSVVRDWLPAGDTLATLETMRRLGVDIQVTKSSPTAWDLVLEGRGLRGLEQSDGALDCKNAGTLIRLIAGILPGQSFTTILDGSDQLRKRPMQRIIAPLTDMGASIASQNGYAPLHISPTQLRGIRYEMPMASAQVKSAVLLAGLYADGDVAVFQPGPARDHTERMLKAMGVTITEADNWITLPHQPDLVLNPLDMTVPADISSAAFVLVAASIVPHSDVTIAGVGVNDTRTGILELLAQMGANVAIGNESVTSGEPVADMRVRFGELHAADIGGSVVVRAIDEFPILTVAATQSAGKTTVRDAKELRVKEVDRIAVLARELAKMGVVMNQHDDGYSLLGPIRPTGAVVDSHDDHRLGMSLAIMGLVATSPTTVLNAGCVEDSFPGFTETMQALGANMAWE